MYTLLCPMRGKIWANVIRFFSDIIQIQVSGCLFRMWLVYMRWLKIDIFLIPAIHTHLYNTYDFSGEPVILSHKHFYSTSGKFTDTAVPFVLHPGIAAFSDYRLPWLAPVGGAA